MSADKNTTLSHVYGVAGLVPGLVGLVYLVKTNAPWQEYALLGSGWVTAIFYAYMLFRCFTQARADGELIGSLREQQKSLEKELHSRNSTLSYLSGLLMGGEAKPRKVKPTKVPLTAATQGDGDD